MSAPVAVAVVAHDSAADLPACLEAVGRLDPRPAELVVVDCASRDDSARVARAALPALSSDIASQVLEPGRNLGFSGGNNLAIAATGAEWILTLNPDAEPAPDFLARLLAHASRPRAAALTGRLLRPGRPPTLDACAMRLTRAWRHLDRGSGEPDRGQYGVPERVFGATGAASLWRRAALADVAVDGAAFDETFHSFREDAELCFRLQERQWEVVYEPSASGVHRRRVLPERRRRLPAEINRRSLANRYLLRAWHQSPGNFLATLPWTLPRDLAALVWVLARERTSLPAYGWLWRQRRSILDRRRRQRSRRTAPAGAVERWFRIAGEPL